MNTPKGILIRKSGKQRIVFQFKQEPEIVREKVLSYFKQELLTWLDEGDTFIPKKNILFMTLTEIVKNIHDHADNRGMLSLFFSTFDKEINFYAGDLSHATLDFGQISEVGYSTRRFGENAGVGIPSILDFFKGVPFVEYSVFIDKGKGVRYTGSFQYQ